MHFATVQLLRGPSGELGAGEDGPSLIERRSDMIATSKNKMTAAGLASLLALSLLAGCASTAPREPRQREPYVTKHDRTWKGAGIGAAGAVLAGKREADEILVGAAIGAVVGGGVGAYMDHQQEKLARIPGTTV